MKIDIGKASDNDYVVDDPHVSRYHARLTKGETEDAGWILEDLDSTNGTFVNDLQIVKKEISYQDRIRLGNNSMMSLSDILKQQNDYSEDFMKLKRVYENYIQEKVKIQSSNHFKARMLQMLPFAIPGIIGVVIGFMGKGNQTLFIVSLLVAICAPVIGIYLGARQSAKIPLLLQELSNQFKIDYVCPKCGTFLGEIPWESLQKKKHCPISACKAKWVSE